MKTYHPHYLKWLIAWCPALAGSAAVPNTNAHLLDGMFAVHNNQSWQPRRKSILRRAISRVVDLIEVPARLLSF